MQKLKRAIEELLGCSYQPKLPPQRANKLPPQPNCLMTEHQWEHDAAAMERFFAAVDANGNEPLILDCDPECCFCQHQGCYTCDEDWLNNGVAMSDLVGEKSALLCELSAMVAKVHPEDGLYEITPQIRLHRSSAKAPCSCPCVYHPMLSFLLQGQKRAEVDDHIIEYHAGDVFIAGLDMPAQYRVMRASKEQPLLAISFLIEPMTMQEVMLQLQPLEQQNLMECEFSVLSDHATLDELKTIRRVMELVERGTTNEYPYNLMVRELYYYILSSQHGLSLRKIFTSGAQDYKIAKVIHYLKDNYRRSDIEVENLAQMVYMAVPTFYRHFKEATSLSPLQYLKRLRLFEAKRLMISESMSASAAGYEVGYISEQHFSRDYKKFFGRPPMQDVAQSITINASNEESLVGAALQA
ncbi:MAG: AraC family transcriptional regulator [Anaerobiospirillum sp.]|nr:AraC family transcriptional regulator [Anaerobiospirillum sp.]